MIVIGLMSGTSLDGVDAALVEINGAGVETNVKVLGFQSTPIPNELRERIERAISSDDSHSQLLCSLNFELGHLFAEAAKNLCKRFDFPLEKVDLIGSHGQTIYHQPNYENEYRPSTLQLGEPAVIAYETGVCVVSNFRTMDMAAGGQGAPLVPYTEYLLYRQPNKDRILQNIGGIGNATILPQHATLDDVIAFDTGPGNMVIDEICKQLFHLPYDRDGDLAKGGTIQEEILDYCMSHPFISQPPPKSTGREVFGKEWTQDLIRRFSHHTRSDLLASVTMFTAKSIIENYRRYIFPRVTSPEVIVSGGGSFNKTLIQMIRSLLPPECTLILQEDLGFSSESKEAIAFAILANETIHGKTGNIPRATGAKQAVILGNITLPYPVSLSKILKRKKGEEFSTD